jgi:uncharacterized protein YbbK (DUF523 family)
MLSACLAGVRCVYDGSHKRRPLLAALHKKGGAVLFCPEVLGGLKIPHPPSEIKGGDGAAVLRGQARVVSRDGSDVTAFFLEGAEKALALAIKKKIKRAVTKARSPSCGCGLTYDGTFTKTLIAGDGVTTALLKQSGVEVTDDETFLKKQKASKASGSHAKN